MNTKSKIVSRATAVAGLTLIEILVVMAIMTIIAGSIIVAMVGGMGKGQEGATKGILGTIAAQMDQYHHDHRMYIPGDSDNSTFPVWQALQHGTEFTVKKDYLEAEDAFTDPATGASVTRYRYVDAWRIAVEYTCDPPYTRFELRSSGRDLEMNTDDDIVITD